MNKPANSDFVLYDENLLDHQESPFAISQWQVFNDVTGAESLWFELDLAEDERRAEDLDASIRASLPWSAAYRAELMTQARRLIGTPIPTIDSVGSRVGNAQESASRS